MTLRPLAAMLALALPAATALADARISFQATEGGGADIQGLLIGHGKVRSDADGNVSVIMNPADGSMTMLDHGKREYTRIGRAEMEQMSGALSDAMAQLESAMANMPPEVRAQMQGMVGGGLPGMGGEPLVKVVDTGQRDRVAGHSCTIYRTQVQGRAVNESCMGDASVLSGLSAADRATLDGVMAMTRSMMESLASGPMAQFADMTPFKDGLVPLRVTDLDGGRRATSEFAGIDNASLPADLFQVPSGYREQKIEMPRLGR